jgi:RNA polymerase sigma factor (sigma-70 family)
MDLHWKLLIEKLPERDQKILGLYCDGLGQQEIAEELGIDQSNVQRALKKIQQKLRAYA